MAISLKTAGTWARMVTDGGTVTIPGSPAAGDRMFLFGTWKDFAITVADPSGWTPITAFTDGAVNAGNGAGSVKVAAWYRNWQSGDGNPAIDYSAAPTEGHWVIQLFQKGASDVWGTPVFATAAIAANDPWSATASATVDIADGSVVFELVGLRDDSSTIARDTNTALDDDGSPAVTWNGNIVESPATHFTSTTGLDMAGDLIHRFVTTGAAGVSLTTTGDPAAAETGACLWVVQGLATDITVTPNPVADTLAVTAPTIGLVLELTPPPIVATPAVPAPAVDPVYGLAPAPVATATAVTAPAVTYDQAITPGPVAATAGVPSPTLESLYTATPDPIAAQLAVTAPAVDPVYGLIPAPVAVATAVTTPAVEAVVTLGPAPVAAASSVTAPTLDTPLGLAPAPVTAVTAVPAPTVDIPGGGGTVTVTPDPVPMIVTVTTPVLASVFGLEPGPVAATLDIPAPLLGLVLAMQPAPVPVTTGVPLPDFGFAVPGLAARMSLAYGKQPRPAYSSSPTRIVDG